MLKFIDCVIMGAKVYHNTRIHWSCNAPNYIRYKYVNRTASNVCFNFIYIFIILCLRVPTRVLSQQLFYSAPNYGEECQSVCQCPSVYCHFATGCPQHDYASTDHQTQGILFLTGLLIYPITIFDPIYKNSLSMF